MGVFRRIGHAPKPSELTRRTLKSPAILREDTFPPFYFLLNGVLTLSELVAGVDEAGRGPVIGPLVVCGVALPAESLDGLSEAGVKNSKKLSPERRERLAEQIKENSETVETAEFTARTIDRLREDGANMDRIGAIGFTSVLKGFDAGAVHVDPPGRALRGLPGARPNVFYSAAPRKDGLRGAGSRKPRFHAPYNLSGFSAPPCLKSRAIQARWALGLYEQSYY